MTFAAAVKIPTNRRAAGSSGTLYAWYVTCVLTVAYFTSYIDRIILSLLVEPIKRDLGASDTAMSLLLGLAFAVFYAVLGIPIARWADRASRKWIIAAGIFLWSITTAMTGLARTYGEVFIARVGVGVGEAALTPAAYSMLSDQFPPISLSRPMSLYHMGAILGIGTAFVIGGAVAQFARLTSALTLPVLGTIHTWQLAFIIVGFPGLAIALLVALTVAEPARTGARMLGRVSWRACLRFVFERRRAYSALILGPAICGTFAFGAMSWMPTYLIRVHRLPPGRAGLWFGAAVIVSNVGGFLAGGMAAQTRPCGCVCSSHGVCILCGNRADSDRIATRLSGGLSDLVVDRNVLLQHALRVVPNRYPAHYSQRAARHRLVILPTRHELCGYGGGTDASRSHLGTLLS